MLEVHHKINFNTAIIYNNGDIQQPFSGSTIHDKQRVI
jgi:hypothetical protein